MNLFHATYNLIRYKYLQAYGSSRYSKMLKSPFISIGGSLLCAMVMVLSSSCSEKDNLDRDVFPDSTATSKYYISLSVDMPELGKTRSYTVDSEGNSNSGRENATENENLLQSAEIYLCQDNEVKLKLITETMLFKTDGSVVLTAEFDGLDDLVDMVQADEEVEILIVGNTEESNLSHDLDNGKKSDKATFEIKGASSRPIGDFEDNGKIMPLVNAHNFKIKLEKGDDKEETLEKIKSLFQRGQGRNDYLVVPDILHLERAVARIEYQDMKEYRDEGKLPATPHIYKIESTNDVYVEIAGMQVFNINNKSYLFRQTSVGDDEGVTNISNLKLLEYEKGDNDGFYNWVATPDWQSPIAKNVSGFYNKFKLTDDAYGIDGNTSLTYITIDDLFKRSDALTGYHPWCYVSENTLPSVEMMEDFEELTKYATGVMFKVMICSDDKGTPLTYSRDRTGYPDEISNSPSKPRVIEIMDKQGNWVESKEEDGKYYLNYIACIVHNDAPTYTTTFAPMYFGIVRNNTYQMRVKSIKDLPNPKEPKSLYLQLQVEVMPWQLRQNSFEF